MFQIGASAVDITPRKNVDLTGFIARENPMTGVLDPIYVRAFFVRDRAGECLLIIAADVLALNNEWCRRVEQKIAQQLQISSRGIVITATHTHSAPATVLLRKCGEMDNEFMAGLERAVLEAAFAARAFADQAELGFASTAAPGWCHNRRIEKGPVDPALSLVQARVPGSGPLASLVSFACHPVSLGAENRRLSPDYPAYLIRELEPDMGIGVFLLPPCGNVNPVRSGDREFTRRMGHDLGLKAGNISKNLEIIDAGKIGISTKEIFLEYSDPPSMEYLRSLIADSRPVMEKYPPLDTRSRELEAMTDWASELMDSMQKDSVPHGIECRLKAYKIGDLVLVTVGAEIFVEFSLELKNRFPDFRIFPISCANGNTGYVPAPEYFGKGYYETDSAYRYYGLLMPAPDSFSKLLDTAAGMIESLENNT